MRAAPVTGTAAFGPGNGVELLKKKKPKNINAMPIAAKQLANLCEVCGRFRSAEGIVARSAPAPSSQTREGSTKKAAAGFT
jgi:hypothetical protein